MEDHHHQRIGHGPLSAITRAVGDDLVRASPSEGDVQPVALPGWGTYLKSRHFRAVLELP